MLEVANIVIIIEKFFFYYQSIDSKKFCGFHDFILNFYIQNSIKDFPLSAYNSGFYKNCLLKVLFTGFCQYFRSISKA